MPLEVLPHDPRYKAAFEEMSTRLRAALGELVVSIQHLGSTSVPGLLAKPKIDLFIESRTAPPPSSAVTVLVDLGFALSPHVDKLGHHAYNREGPPEFALHWCEVGSPVVSAARRFRDMLLADAQVRKRYQDAKLAALNAHPDDAWQYNQHKAHVIREALAET